MPRFIPFQFLGIPGSSEKLFGAFPRHMPIFGRKLEDNRSRGKIRDVGTWVDLGHLADKRLERLPLQGGLI